MRRPQGFYNDKVKEPVEQGCERDADRRGHDQSCLAHRLGMMDAVKEKGNPFHFWSFRREVKDEAVHHILCQSPEKDADRKTQDNLEGEAAAGQTGQMVFDGDIQKIRHDRNPDNGDHCRVNVGEKFKEVGFKQANRLFVLHDIDVMSYGHGLTSRQTSRPIIIAQPFLASNQMPSGRPRVF